MLSSKIKLYHEKSHEQMRKYFRVIEDSDALQSIDADAFGKLYSLGKLLVFIPVKYSSAENLIYCL